MPKPLRVDLGHRSYPVHVGTGILATAGALISDRLDGRKVAVVSDRQVADLYSDPLLRSLSDAGFEASLLLVPPAEAAKTFEVYADLQCRLVSRKIGRDGAILALGGGCVGDLAGFAAATLYRGVRLVQVPTTLLAQVDSSIGGKTGINAPQGKNLIGALHQPVCVLADVDVLNTLPEAEQLAGYAELYKAGLLGSRDLVGWLVEHGGALLAGDPDSRIAGVRQAITIKANVVASDECENGQRALLNLGHTFAHALEAEEGQSGAITHGLAVSVGLAMAAEVSARSGYCRPGVSEEIHAHLVERGLPVRPSELPGAPFDPQDLLQHMGHDKKVRRGQVRLVLLREIGDAFLCEDPDWEIVQSVVSGACAA